MLISIVDYFFLLCREISATEYDKVSNETLESLTEFFDEIVEQAEHLEDADVSYGVKFQLIEMN